MELSILKFLGALNKTSSSLAPTLSTFFKGILAKSYY